MFYHITLTFLLRAALNAGHSSMNLIFSHSSTTVSNTTKLIGGVHRLEATQSQVNKSIAAIAQQMYQKI
jgi:metal-dependent hydrolase (beta-lactamase superfamily II)